MCISPGSHWHCWPRPPSWNRLFSFHLKSTLPLQDLLLWFNHQVFISFTNFSFLCFFLKSWFILFCLFVSLFALNLIQELFLFWLFTLPEQTTVTSTPWLPASFCSENFFTAEVLTLILFKIWTGSATRPGRVTNLTSMKCTVVTVSLGFTSLCYSRHTEGPQCLGLWALDLTGTFVKSFFKIITHKTPLQTAWTHLSAWTLFFLRVADLPNGHLGCSGCQLKTFFPNWTKSTSSCLSVIFSEPAL